MTSFSTFSAFAETEPIEIEIPVKCEAKNLKEEFIYHLEPATDEFQIIENLDLKLTDGKTDSFKIVCTYPGTYYYTLNQQKGKSSNVIYDESVYSAVAYVTESDDSELMVETILFKKGEDSKREMVEFTNKRIYEDEDSNTGVSDNLFLYAFGTAVSLCLIILLTKKKKEV